MDSHELKQLLDAVRDGRITSDEAASRIAILPFQDAGDFAKVDLHRRVRCGFPEVVFGQGKTRRPRSRRSSRPCSITSKGDW